MADETKSEHDPYGGPLAQWADGVESLRAAREAYVQAAKREGYMLALRRVLEHTEFIHGRCAAAGFTAPDVAKNIEMKIKRLLAELESLRSDTFG